MGKKSSLVRAVKQKEVDLEKIEKLFRKGADPNEKYEGQMLIFEALRRNRKDVAVLFIQYGLDLYAKVEYLPHCYAYLFELLADDDVVLNAALEVGLKDSLDKELNSIHPTKMPCYTVYHHIVNANPFYANLMGKVHQTNAYEIARILSRNQEAHLLEDQKEFSYLYDENLIKEGMSEASGFNQSIKWLLENVRGYNKTTVLEWASVNASVWEGVADLLEESIAEVPIHRALVSGNIGTAKELLEAGSDVNIKNQYGDTPLTTAIKQHSKYPLLWLLRQPGVDVNVVDGQGKTPFQLLSESRGDHGDKVGVYAHMVRAGLDRSVFSDFGSDFVKQIDDYLLYLLPE